MSGEGLALVMASMWVSGAGIGFIIRGLISGGTSKRSAPINAVEREVAEWLSRTQTYGE